ncbi:DUF2913 family protein [Vibrio sp. TBV020]|uniref:DUF2913 family protein n=1 Tax=Vibrio sp. TBV020 TaxID=3137398 RepID=UPI0038CD195D
MSTALKQFQTFDKLVVHSLFVLYFEIQKAKGYVPIKKRNEILVKHLKTLTKKREFVTHKKEIKTMLSIGRNAKGNLEKRLHELNQMNLSYRAKFTQADELYILLDGLYRTHDFASQIWDENIQREQDVIYMTQKEIEEGFDDKQTQKRPLRLCLSSERGEHLLQSVQGHPHYDLDFIEQDEENFTWYELKRAS